MTNGRSPSSRYLLIAGFAALSSLLVGLLALLHRLTKRYGLALLRLEELEQKQVSTEPPSKPPDPVQYLFQHGAPAGSVGMNFELPSLSGQNYTLTQFKGRRVLLIFFAPSCPFSRSMLPGLAQLPTDPPPDQPLAVIISTGDPAQNRQLMEEHGIRLPVLIQEHNEVALLYFVGATPMAYLLDAEGITEIGRIVGPQAILGVAFATMTGQESLPDNTVSPSDQAIGPSLRPLRRGDPLPAFQLPSLDGQSLTNGGLRGRHSLVVLFDPLCLPCIDLLPDLARVQADPNQAEVVMISRRDPELTRALAGEYDMPYPIAFQQHWDLSRRVGTLAVPAAFLVGPDGQLDSELAIGQQAIFDLLKQMRRARTERRLVSLPSLLR